jgi:hypothetical protein
MAERTDVVGVHADGRRGLGLAHVGAGSRMA